jgi:hypothetical protein
MTLGRFIYLAYHRPRSLVRASIREGGPIEQWKTERGRKEMEAAARRLPSIRLRDEETKRLEVEVRSAPSVAGKKLRVASEDKTRAIGQEARGNESDGKPLEIHMLVGTRFWFMAAYALVSLQQQVDRAVHVHLYDDGTLEVKQREKLEMLAGKVTFYDRSGIEARIDRFLPESKFPFIRERLRNYPNLKKLTDPHIGSIGAKLVMDADVLFFGKPVELLEWVDKPESILCATDVTESYGYSRALMEKLAGAPIPARINVGITGLQSEQLEWDRIEDWCRELITREKTNYYLEQTLVAMLCASRLFTQLDLARYITGPSDEQVMAGQGVMQHYVDLSKKEYFRSAWRRFTTNA